MSDFVLFSGSGGAGTASCYSPGYAVLIGSGSTVSGGSIGSLRLINTTGTVTVTGNVFSKGTITLANSNVVKGNIAASNSAHQGGTILSVGNNANLGLSTANTINVNGKIIVAGGTVKSKVTHPIGTTYTGPKPAGGNITGVPALPTYPALPPVTTFPFYGSTDITTTKTIGPGKHGEVKLTGGKTLTLKGTGVYIFKEIKNYNSNNFVFDFENNPTGTFLIYVHRNVDVDKLSVSMINGGSATRIYTEIHGLGWSNKLYGFDIANGSSGGTATKWLGTVWCPYSAINIGSGTGSSTVTGALWSGTQINIKNNVTIVHAPFLSCTPPTLTVVDATVCSAAAGGNTATVNLNEYITISGGTATFSLNGSAIANPATYLATNGNVITVTATSSGSCFKTATFKITVNDQQSFGICAPATGKTTDLIGSELTSLNKVFNAGGHPTSSEVFFIIGNKVLIDIIYFPSGLSQLLATLPGMGLSDYVVNDQVNEDGTVIITGFFPMATLTQLNPMGNLINYVRPTPPPIGNSGTATTLGDKALRSDLVRLGYDIGGQGVKIGVISDSYSTLDHDDIASGDLPGEGNPFGRTTAVEVLKEYPYGPRTDEGRAMLQIIHDIAPEASLAFRTGWLTSNDFAKGIREMEQAGCDIITDDITYVTEPFFGDGIVSKAVNDVTAQGVSYFTAAGNFGNRSYEGTFSPTTINGLVAHNYGGGDAGQSITVGPGANGQPTTYTIVLQWQDPVYSTGGSGTQNDLDIYLTNDQGITRFGFNRNNLGGDPVEILTFTMRENTTTDIMVVRAAGNDPVKFKYVAFRGDNIIFNEHNNGGLGYSTIVGQANSVGAMTVGAVLYSNTPAFNYSRPDGSEEFGVASFSSVGGTTIGVADRVKPDFIAPNGVNTTVFLNGKDINLPDNPGGDLLPNFFGTSAAAPHAAAVAALIMEARSKYQPSSPAFQPGEIRNLLKSTARNMYANGYDVKSGAGFIRADQALLTIAAPDPAIINPLIVPGDVTPGDEPFTVVINGTNLNANSEVLLRGNPIPSTFNETTGQLLATVPLFEGNPPITVRNEPIANGDGGTSEPLFFFGTAKSRIVIKADIKTKKFGEEIPAYTASVLVEVNGTLVANVLTLANVGLTNNPDGEVDASGRQLIPVTISGPTSELVNANPTGYILIPSHAQTDLTFRELFTYDTPNYVTGRLIVEKMPLNITPNNLTYVYGEKFDDLITFTYTLGGDGYDPNLNASTLQTILNNVEEEHETQLYDNVVALVDSRQLVNASRQLVNSDLSNLSFMSSSRALVNSRQLVNASRQLVNTVTNVVDFDQRSIFNYRDSQTDDVQFVDTLTRPVVNSRQLVNQSRALVNSRQLVNGSALVSASRQLVNASRQLVNSSAGAAIVNGSTVGDGEETSNADVLVIVDSLDVYSNPIINSDNEEVYEIPQLFSINMVTGVTTGTWSIVPGAYLSGNFDIRYGLGTLTITPATLTVSSDNKEITYGENQPTYTSAIDGFVLGDTEADVVESITYELKDQEGGLRPSTGLIDAGVYDIIPDVILTETELLPGLPVNYVLEYESPAGKLTVKKSLLTITADAGQKKTYGNPDPTPLTYTVTSGTLFGSDAFTGSLGRVAGENVGLYAIKLGTLALNNSYTLTLVPANFEITQRAVTVTANPNQTKVYGSSDPALTYSITLGTLATGDSFTGALTRAAGENVGSFAIGKGTLALNGNYALTYVPANFSITAKPIAVTPTAGQFKYVGELDPVLTYSITTGGLAVGDSFTGVLGRNPGEGIGTYAIKLGTLALSTNYALSLVPADFKIMSPPPPVIKSFETAFGAGSNPATVNKPSGTVAGNLLVVGLMFEKGSGSTPTPPSGWTLIRRENKLNYVGMATYYKVAGSNEPTSYTFTLSNSPKWSIGISRIEGADPVNPVIAHSGAFGHDNDDVKAPSITTNVYNALVMAFYTNKKDATWTPPAGTTEVYDKPNTQQGLTSNMMAYYVMASPGATGSKTAVPSKKEVWVAQQLAIKPAKSKSGSSSGRSNESIASETPVEEVPLFGESAGAAAVAYPNPVRDHVTVQIVELTEKPANSDINILDPIGRAYPVNSGWDEQNKALGLDFTPMGTGIYFIRVKTKAGLKTVRVVKETE